VNEHNSNCRRGIRRLSFLLEDGNRSDCRKARFSLRYETMSKVQTRHNLRTTIYGQNIKLCFFFAIYKKGKFFPWCDSPLVGLGLLLIHEDFCGL